MAVMRIINRVETLLGVTGDLYAYKYCNTSLTQLVEALLTLGIIYMLASIAPKA